jgi:hypothetical protein
MPKTRAPDPAEFRQQIIELAQAGRHPAELSREFGSEQSDDHQLGRSGRARRWQALARQGRAEQRRTG